jgi:HK97 family phage major capsid protein
MNKKEEEIKDEEKEDEKVEDKEDEKEEPEVDEDEEKEDKAIEKLARKFAKIVSKEATLTQKEIDSKKSKLYAQPKKEEFPNKDVKILRFLQAVVTKDMNAIQKIQPLVEGTAAMGGFLVPEEWANLIVENKLDDAVLEPRCTVLSMTTDTLHLPRLTSRPHAKWRSELGVKSTTTANWDELTLTPYSKAAIITLSEELVMDAAVGEARSIVSHVSRLLSRAMLELDEKAIMQGSGTGQPTGITTYAIGALNAAGALNAGHIVAAYHQLGMGYRKNASWIMSSRALQTVRGLRDTTGQLIVAFQNINNSPTEILMGRPILECNHMAETDIYFGDLSYYYIGRREGLRIRTTDEATVASYSAFERDLVHVKAEERVDGELALVEAFRRIQNIA